MSTYVLIHGSGSDAWYWHRVVPELRARGHAVIAPDLPTADDSAGLNEYADVVVEAIGDSRDLIVVAQSLGGFTAPIVASRVSVSMLILIAAMVPLPGESPAEWFSNTGWAQARQEQAQRDGRSLGDGVNVIEEFFHDVPADVVEETFARPEPAQSDTPFGEPWPLEAWPEVLTRVMICRNDRFFPLDFMRRVVNERLGMTPDEFDSGHLPALSRPQELVERLEAYRAAA